MKSTILRLTNRLKRTANFPAFRSSVETLSSFYSEQEISPERIVQLILGDLGLCVQVLRAANSAFFNPFKVSLQTISRAAVLLGFDQLKEIARSAPTIDNEELGDTFVHEYALSLLTAHLASATEKDEKLAEELYIAAFFRRFARLVLLHHAPETYDALLSLPKLSRLELFLLLAERLLKYWNLPSGTLLALEGRELQKHNGKSLKNIIIAEHLALSLLKKRGLWGWKRLVESPKNLINAFQRLDKKLYALPIKLQNLLKGWTNIDENSLEKELSAAGENACSLQEILPLLKGLVTAAAKEIKASGKLFYLEEDRWEDVDGEALSPEAQKFFFKVLCKKNFYKTEGTPAFVYLPIHFKKMTPFLIRFKRPQPFSEEELSSLRFLSRILGRLFESQNIFFS